jgi:TonB family protein
MTSNEIGLLPAFTSVVWQGCVAVGVVGLLVPYSRPRAAARDASPVQAEILNIQVAQLPFVAPAEETPAPTPDVGQPPPPPDAAEAPPLPTMAALANPVGAPAFAQPTKQPIRVVQPTQRTFAPVARATETPSAVGHITFGQGEGQQPAPEYPSEAALAGEQGAVVVRLGVNEDGNVTDAQAISPCRWPLLNQAAVRAVRETWHFAAGPRRLYEVSIRFELTE